MARLRSIKPEFWSSEQVMELSLAARLAFIGMWNFCDDAGVHPASAKTLKAEVFPSDDVSIEQVSGFVAEMVAQDLVAEFESGGKRYWHVTGWKHQYIKHPSIKYPPPPGSDVGALPPPSGNIPPGRGESYGNSTTGRPPEKEKEKEREKEGKPTPASGKPMRGACASTDAFDRFWDRWPKKVGKQDAKKAMAVLKPDLPMLAEILDAVDRIVAEPERWRKGDVPWQVLPDPVRWLKSRRWEDEIAPAAAGYGAAEIEVMTAYNVALAECGWPGAVATPFSSDRAAAIRAFLAFGNKAGWVEAYFAWLAEHLPAKEGFGFDWAIQRGTYLRAKEGNFAALREAA